MKGWYPHPKSDAAEVRRAIRSPDCIIARQRRLCAVIVGYGLQDMIVILIDIHNSKDIFSESKRAIPCSFLRASREP